MTAAINHYMQARNMPGQPWDVSKPWPAAFRPTVREVNTMVAEANAMDPTAAEHCTTLLQHHGDTVLVPSYSGWHAVFTLNPNIKVALETWDYTHLHRYMAQWLDLGYKFGDLAARDYMAFVPLLFSMLDQAAACLSVSRLEEDSFP
jgi:hypothetical protein